MANIKITDLTAYGDPTSTDVLPIVDVGADVTKKVSVADLMENAGSGTAAAPGIAFDGDPNTGIYRPGADQVAISTNGTGRLFVDANGSVGIGTESLASDAVLTLSTDSDTALFFRRGSTNQDGAIRFEGGDFQFLNGANSSTVAGLSERLRLTSTGALNFVGAGTAGSTHAVSFNGSAPVDSLVIDSSGRVGLGTSSPSALLTVNGDILSSSSGVALLAQNTTEPSSATDFTAQTIVSLSRTGVPAATESMVARSVLYRYANTSSHSKTGFGIDLREVGTTYNRVVSLQADGKVGIGTTSPGSALEIDAAAATSPFIAKINTSEAARIDSSGRLLVGTSSWYNIPDGYFGNNWQQGQQIKINPSDGNEYGGLAIISASSKINQRIADISLNRQDGSTDYAALSSGSAIGSVTFNGADGSKFVRAASIRAEVDGTPGANDMPGRLVFSVTADGASSPTEAMRIKNTRVINFSNAPVYADNAAAKTGGLVDGDVYRTSTGDLKIVYT